MKNRIRFISHKQKKILLVDGTGCSAEQLEEFATLVPARVTAEPRGSVLLLADFTGAQFDKKNPHYDPKSSPDAPRWVNVDVKFVKKTRLVPLAELRAHKQLATMRVLQRANRLSITPVSAEAWRFIVAKLMQEAL